LSICLLPPHVPVPVRLRETGLVYALVDAVDAGVLRPLVVDRIDTAIDNGGFSKPFWNMDLESESTNRQIDKGKHPEEDPTLPTFHPPGSLAKLEVLRQRAELDLPLSLPGDAGHGVPEHLQRVGPRDLED
jgi:hypothetical protein